MQTEEWRPVVRFEETYEVSSTGRIRSKSRRQLDSRGRLGRSYGGHVLSPERTRLGYLRIRLSDGERSERSLIHRIVAEAFLGPPPTSDAEVNHIDGAKDNNVPTNLEWCSRRGNITHSIHAGLRDPGCLRGVGQKLTADAALAIYGDTRKHTDIASQYQIAASTVAEIKRGAIWSSVTGATNPRRAR